jgi:hypothetical protein
MTMQKLLKTWTLPDRTAERTQITLRLDFDLYAKLHALKEVYKTRSVNDMINDILKAGLDEIVEALPVRKMTIDEMVEASEEENNFHGGDVSKPSEWENTLVGPAREFEWAYKRILETKAVDETETKKLEVA